MVVVLPAELEGPLLFLPWLPLPLLQSVMPEARAINRFTRREHKQEFRQGTIRNRKCER